ncbi:MAG TPA: thiosulfate sulfurtransferase, partial [Alcanivorax sp.]|nr:thiosulfate sulfurtransferase [Alcanivorax sp.]
MTAQLPLLLEPADLAAHLDDDNLLIVDLSKDQVYDQAHVPGAVHLDFKRLLAGTQPAPGLLPSDDALSALFSELGLTPDTQVVAYDDEGGGWAGRLLWTLDVIGHKKYSYLNG